MTTRASTGIGPGFGRLWAAATAGNLGDGVGRVAVALLAATLTRDPLAVALVTALSYVPWLVVGLPVGALLDRHDRRRLAVLAGATRTGAIAVLTLAAATDRASLWLLYAVVLVLATCETFYDNAVVAMVPAVVRRREELERANGRLQGAAVVAERFLGPPLASTVFALGAGYAFGIHAACYALAVVWLLTLPGSYRTRAPVESAAVATSASPATSAAASDPDPGPRPSIRREMVAGLRYLRENRLHRLLLGLALGVFGLASMINGITVLWTLEVLGVSEALYGVFLLTMAFGAIIGSQTAAPLARRIGRARTLRLTTAALGGGGLLAAAATSPYPAGVALVVVGWASVTFNIINVSVRQRITPPGMLGRVTATYRTAGGGVMVVGAVGGGLIASVGGLRLPLLIFGLGCLVVTALAGRLTEELVADDTAHR